MLEKIKKSFRTKVLVRHSFVLEQNPASNAVALQVFFTQYAAKFAEKTRVYACEDRF